MALCNEIMVNFITRFAYIMVPILLSLTFQCTVTHDVCITCIIHYHAVNDIRLIFLVADFGWFDRSGVRLQRSPWRA